MTSTSLVKKTESEIWVQGPKVVEKVVAGLTLLMKAKDRLVHDTFEAQEDLKAIKAYQMPDQASVDNAQSVTADLKLKKKTLEDEKEAVTKPINELLKLVRAAYAPALASLEEGEKHLKKEMAAALRRLREEQTRALQTVAVAMHMGDVETAKSAMDTMPEAAMPRNMSVREIWKFKISDATKIEDRFLMVVVNEAAVQAAIDAGVRELSGFEIYREDSVTIRQDKK